MKYRYTAWDQQGNRIEAVIEATDELAARTSLSDEGLFVSDIHKAGGNTEASSAGPRRFTLSTGGMLKSMAAFCRDLAVLVNNGTPLINALQALERQSKDARFKAVITDVRSAVDNGKSLSEALSSHPEVFDPVAQSLIKAGESGGSLADMLTHLAGMTRDQVRTRNNITAALLYPVVLISVSGIVLIAMIVFVLPRFSELFKTLDMPLPPTTAVMINISDVVRSYWWALLAAVLAGGGGAVAWLSTTAGRDALHRFLSYAPVLRNLTRSFATARMARVLGVLLMARVPFLESLELTRSGINNKEYARLLDEATEATTRGEPISAAFIDSPLVTPAFAEAIRNGERTGRIGPVLASLAEHLDEDNEVLLKSITRTIEPLILTVMGLVVGVIAVSLFLPLFDLTSMTQNGG